MFERVGFGSCPTITAPCPPPSPRRDFNLKHDHCASCVDRPLHQRGVPEMDLTAACAQANPAAAAVQCGMPCTLDPNGKNVDFPESLFWGRAVLPVISMMLLMILVAAGRTLEMAAAVASLEVGTQAVAAMMADGTIGASCQTDVLAGEPRRVVASMRAGCSSFIDAWRRASKQVRVALAMVFLGVTRDRYLTQPPLAVSAGLG